MSSKNRQRFVCYNLNQRSGDNFAVGVRSTEDRIPGVRLLSILSISPGIWSDPVEMMETGEAVDSENRQ